MVAPTAMARGRRQSTHDASTALVPRRGSVSLVDPARLGLGSGRRVEFVTHRGGAFDSQGLLSHDVATVPQGTAPGRPRSGHRCRVTR